jgi:alkaline phosphatase
VGRKISLQTGVKKELNIGIKFITNEIMKRIILTGILVINIVLSIHAQYTTLNAHSHNDYANEVPFWLAYNNHFGSIEADIWAVNGELFVAHNTADIKPERTLDKLYLQPIVKLFKENMGKPWKDNSSTFQLLIDLKTPTEPTLSLLVDKLKQFPDVFDPKINEKAIRVVITGNRPEPSEFGKYPDYIFFDGLLNKRYDSQQLTRVPLYSENLRKFTLWPGEEEIIEKDRLRLENIIDSVHSLNKKIRFWNAPDNPNAWKILIRMRVDYVNTDHIVQLADYLNKGGK